MPSVQLDKEEIAVPLEWFNYCSKPRFIFMHGKQSLWLRSLSGRSWPKLLTSFLFGRGGVLASAQRQEEGKMIYRILLGNPMERRGAYELVNYEDKFLLFSISGQVTTAANRQRFWSAVHGYHEHRRPETQKQDVIKRTRWLAEVLSTFEPASVLELGCGAGRNLFYLQKLLPACRLLGVEINADAAETARQELGSSFELVSHSLYELSHLPDDSIDVIFTSGVLMHVPHEKVEWVVKEMQRISRKGVVLYELHGPSHHFDFHRYPRDYGKLPMALSGVTYEIFDRSDYRNSGTESFNHALLVSRPEA